MNGILSTLKGSNIRPLQGRNLIFGFPFRRFHPSVDGLMTFLPFGEARKLLFPTPSVQFSGRDKTNLDSPDSRTAPAFDLQGEF
jgi:hypothetical protein